MLTSLTALIHPTRQWKPWLRTWSLVIAGVVFALGVYAGLIIWHTPYLGVLRSTHDEVYLVEPASPGAAAGIQVGDRLTHVDGIPINQADPLFGDRQAGDRLSLSLIRAGTPRTVNVTLATPSLSVRVRRLSYLAIALAFWLVGVFVLSRKPNQAGPRLFFALCQTAAVILAALGLAEIQIDWATRLVNVGVLTISALFVHFHTEFPRPKSGRIKKPFLFALYLVSLDLSLIYAGVGPHQLGRYSWFPLFRSGIRLYFVASILVGIALLFHTYLTTDYGPVRRRVRLVLFGTFVALMPVVLLSLVPVALRGSPRVPDEIAALSLVVIPLVYGYGILRHNLMDIDLVINRTVVYLTLTILLILAYLAVVTVASFMTDGLWAGQPLVGAAASLVVAASILPLRSRVQTSVDRLFYRAAYDYQAVVGDVSARLSRTLHEDNLENLLVRQISQAMGLKGAALLLVQSEHLVLREATGTLRRLGHPGTDLLPARGTLAQYLAQAGKPVESSEILPLPSSVIPLPSSDLRLWVPLVLGDELQGILLLGAKHVDEFFSREDHKILATLAHQAALAAKNLQLVEELRRRMAEIDADKEMLRQMNHQAVQIREAERKKLSQELHDQVIQEVIGLKIQLENCRDRVDAPAVRAELRRMAQQAQRMIDDMRRVCLDLRPAVLDDYGLIAALHTHINEFEAQSGLSVRRQFQGEELGLPEEMEVSLFRVVQEALQNVWRHANARTAWVGLAIETLPDPRDSSAKGAGRLELWVADDGQGFILPHRLRDLTRQRHIGLVSMRERVEAMGGQLAIHSAPGQGTTVQVIVPLTERPTAGGHRMAVDREWLTVTS
jgi:signal transduction histidine kinase